MTNVLKNAAEAVEASRREAPSRLSRADQRGDGADDATRSRSPSATTASACRKDGERIVEPYVTTREKGTGLGLAIVKKIVEEHGGDMNFAALPKAGRAVTLRFACIPATCDGRQRGGRMILTGEH